MARNSSGAVRFTTINKTVHPEGSTEETKWARNMTHYLPGVSAANTYRAIVIRTLPSSSGAPSRAGAVQYQYDKNGNMLSQSEYSLADYANIPRDSFGGPNGVPAGASLLRKTTRTFFNQTGTAGDGTENVPEYSSAYWNPGVGTLNLLAAAEIAEGTGVVASRLEYTYDNAGTTANLLTIKSWDSTKGSYSNSLAANSISQSFTYDSYGNRLTSTDGNSVTAKTVFDGQSLYPTSVIAALGEAVETTTNLSYDFRSGVLLSSTAYANTSSSVATKCDYDNIGRATNVHEANGLALERQTLSEYADDARRVAVYRDKDATGDKKLVTVTHYDPLSRVRLVRELEDPSPQFVTDETAGIKTETRYGYVSGAFKQLQSNPFRAAKSSAAGAESTMGWTLSTTDAGGRVTSIQRFSGASAPAPWGNAASTGTVSNSFDGEDTTTADEEGKSRTLSRDALGRLAKVTEAPGALNYSTTYDYDALDNLTQVTKYGTSGTQTRTFVYDSLKRLAASTNPENYFGSIYPPGLRGCVPWLLNVYANCYSYDNNGNVVKNRENRGLGITYSYDKLNRLKSQGYVNDSGTINDPGVSYTYDDANVAFSKGRLTAVSTQPGTFLSAADTSTTNVRAYDALGRVVSSSQTTAGNTYTFPNYSYNLAGSLRSETYPSGRVLNICYDGANRVKQLGSNDTGCSTTAGAYASNFQYGPQGAQSSYTMGNNVFHQAGFNSRLQMSGFTELANNDLGQQLLRATYDYFSNGNLKHASFSNGGPGYTTPLTFGQDFTYDEVNRLKTASDSGGWSRSFDYDAFGNMTPAGNPTPPTVSFDVNNQMAGVAYDQAGDQMSANGNTLAYDFNHRIRTVTDGQSQAVERYVYDGDGRRVQKYLVNGSARTVFVYDATGQLAAEYSTVANSSPCVTCYLTPDSLGTARLVTDANRNVVARHDYLPFGEEVAGGQFGRDGHWGAGNDLVNQKFTGKERDQESGLDYFGARYYGSGLGRFTSTDSIISGPHKLKDPQNWNLYTYARDNPLRFTDPSGEIIEEDIDEKYQKRFKKWLDAYLATKAGQAEWNKYASDDKFLLKITVGDNAGGKQGAETGSFTWGNSGGLSGATITLGQDLGSGYPSPVDYPITSALQGTSVSGDNLAGAKIAHEFGHVDNTASENGALFQLQQRLIPQYNSIFLSNGHNLSDPALQSLRQQMGGSPLSIQHARESAAESNTIPYLRDRLPGRSLPNQVRQAIENFQKENQ